MNLAESKQKMVIYHKQVTMEKQIKVQQKIAFFAFLNCITSNKGNMFCFHLDSLCVRCQQIEQFLVIEAGPDELTPGHPAVIVDVHPLEYTSSALLNSLIL